MGLLQLILGVLGYAIVLSSLALTIMVRHQTSDQKRSEAYIKVAKYLGENPTLFKKINQLVKFESATKLIAFVFFFGGWIVYSINSFLIDSLDEGVRVIILWASIALFVILTIVQMMLEFRHKKLLAFPLSNIFLVENTAGEKRWILSKILLMIGTVILTIWLQLVAQ
ncbi:hypothetical protein KZR06_16350 (plasmid) [Lacticaseibacillus paracasei]|uniref:hypothetical protein n=1 Tax=Lacticaseibacillus paracasei TaxID=1597 RepID=UPI0021A856BC|nr:hypothetical protein [Lacticaseibacillus paracasei]UWP78334.1 hypothetical protein KZR06_16350 [Lacticaseibacillus paracasei]